MPLIGSVQTAAPIAYEALYEDSRTRLTQQIFLLTGHRPRAEQCVRRAFQLAWNRWDEVAADPSPEGWIRAAAFGLALVGAVAAAAYFVLRGRPAPAQADA